MAEHSRGFRIAIIGMACRFPGAESCEQFWANLANGVESIHRYTREELLAQHAPADLIEHASFVPMAPLLPHVGEFDAALFDFPPHEAELLDPQQRLLLECAWESLERAGHDPACFPGPIGVFAGTGIPSYAFENLRGQYALSAGFEAMLGNDKDFVASRIAYKLDLRGPAIAVQTACSTSLVALHLACQSLLAGECDMALAGGVSIRIPHIGGYMYQPGMIASPDGHCRAFDADAAGTVSSSGAGMLVLRRLDEAIEARDNILAVVRGSAVNNDGSLKAGFSAPSAKAQATVIREAIAVAGLEPDDISCVEAHGTATPLGDPVEVDALNEVFREVGERGGKCALGSVKTNIGHTDTAAGVAGIIKTVLAMQHRELPASLHYRRPNPAIRFERGPFEVVSERRHWASAGPRRAGVSSFGMGGTNAHVVLEEWVPEETKKATERPLTIPLSARSKEALKTLSDQVAGWLEQNSETPISAAALSLATGRRPLAWRTFLVAESGREAAAALRHGATPACATPSGEPPVAFLFSGEERLYPGMVRPLMAERAFRERLEELAKVCHEETGEDVVALLADAEPGDEAAARLLMQPRLAQPALFMVQESLARLLMSWGIKPDAVLGQGAGEFTAAAIAGIFDTHDALRLVCRRGALLEPIADGSGTTAPDSVNVDRFQAEVARFRRRAPGIAAISSITGRPLTAEQAMQHRYWAEQLCQSETRFAHGIATLKSEPMRLLLEVGPGRERASIAGDGALQTLPGADEAKTGDRCLAEALGQLWTHGVRIDWEAYHREREGVRVVLPTYPFERQRYWIEPAGEPAASATRRSMDDWFYLPTWKPAGPVSAVPLSGSFLLLGDDTPFRSELARLLEARGARVRCVAEARPDDLMTGTNDLHCIGLTPLDSHTGQQGIDACYHAPLQLLQMVASSRATPRVTFVSRAAEPVLAGATQTPMASMLAGLVMAARQELAEISVGSIDLGEKDDAAELVAALQAGCAEPAFAWRSGRAWVPAYRKLTVPGNEAPSLRRNLVCVITGGLGGIGLCLAERLAVSAQARLALITRSAFPERSAWDELEDDARYGERIRRLRRMEAAGAEVLTLQADVADLSELKVAIGKARARFGAIHGAIHAAGIAGGSLLAVRSQADADQVLRPKVLGAIALAEALLPDTLDLLAFSGSLTATVGGFGQSDYIAGNAFLDRFAHSLRLQGVPAISIDWDTWSESGMAVSPSIPAELRKIWEPSLAHGIRDAQGGEIFERALELSLPRVVISTTPLETRLAASASDLAESLRKVEAQHRDAPKHPRPVHLPPAEPARTEVESRLCEAFAANLGFAPIGAEDDYFECGGDSLTGISLVGRVEAALGETVHVAALFEAPSPRLLAAYLERNYPQSVSRWTSGATSALHEDAKSSGDAKLTAADIEAFRTALPRCGPRTRRPATRNRRAVFPLSPPRTGSTLLRAMLAGHPKLFAPPELALLSFNTFGERNAAAPEDAALFEGPVQALRTALNCDWEEARAEMAGFGPSTFIADYYARLQSLIGDRLLVDKTPHYVLDRETLKRAEEDFEDPLYLMLQRHPYGMIRSYVESRIDLLLPAKLRKDSQFTRRQLGELIWMEGYRNIREFSRMVPENRQHWIRFEALTADPERAMRDIADFLGIEFDERMLNPYSDEEQRMTGSFRAGARPLGDIKFHRYSAVEHRVAEQWREEYAQDFLSDEAAALARSMGYKLLADERSAAEPLPVDELTDAEVEAELARYFEPTA